MSSPNAPFRDPAFGAALGQGVSFAVFFHLAMIWTLVPSLPSFNLISRPLNKALYFRHPKEADIGRAEVLFLSHL